MYKVVACSSSGGGIFESIVTNQKHKGYQVTQLVVDRECGAVDKAKKYIYEIYSNPENSSEESPQEESPDSSPDSEDDNTVEGEFRQV